MSCYIIDNITLSGDKICILQDLTGALRPSYSTFNFKINICFQQAHLSRYLNEKVNNYDFADMILTGEIPTDVDSAFRRSLFNNLL